MPAVFGELDLQVPPEHDLGAIERALREAGNRSAGLVKMPGLNHFMQTAQTGLPQEYGRIEETLSPAALARTASWLQMQAESNNAKGE